MGIKHAKPSNNHLEDFQEKSDSINHGLETLRTTFQDISENFPSKTDVEERLNQIQTHHTNNNKKIEDLIEVTKSQQQMILELNSKYTDLFETCYQQQRDLTEMVEKYQEKLGKCEKNLQNTKNSLLHLEKVTGNPELRIRKTINMIQKEKIVVKTNSKLTDKKLAYEKARDRIRNAKLEKKNEQSNVKNNVEKSELLQNIENREPTEERDLVNTLEYQREIVDEITQEN